jgi:hypothetical protein
MEVDQELDEPRSAARLPPSEPVPPYSTTGSDSSDFGQVFLEMQAVNPTRSPLRAALGKQLSAVFDSALGSVCGHGASSSSSGSVGALKGSSTETVPVFLRLRPLLEGEVSAIEVKADGCSVRATAPAPLNERKEFKDPRDYSFTSVMDETTSQETMYSATAEDIVHKFQAEGKSGLIFTYGVTNAGKSHTVLGTNADPGLLPRALDQIMAKLDAAQGVSEPSPSRPTLPGKGDCELA